MTWLVDITKRLIDSGVTSSADQSGGETRYIRFLNATLTLFGLTQLPVFALLIYSGLRYAIIVNGVAFGFILLSYLLNRRGAHVWAKILMIIVLITNTTYFAVLVGSAAPTHFWLVPCAMLATLVFKPEETVLRVTFVSLIASIFILLNDLHLNLVPILDISSDPMIRLRAAEISTGMAMIMTLALAGMMHRRFAQTERELSKEQAESERLLRAILPEDIMRELKTRGVAPAIRHEDVSLLFADIVGFTPLAASMPAEEVVAILAEIFQRFDELIERCEVEKIKTIGDAYMVASGVPKARGDHAERLGRCALGMLEIFQDFSAQSEHQLQLRIGLHRGPAVAGVIGTTKFAYDLWGESVNLASRLESSGEPGRIHVSTAYREGLEEVMRFEERGEVTLKGVGRVKTHWLVSAR